MFNLKTVQNDTFVDLISPLTAVTKELENNIRRDKSFLLTSRDSSEDDVITGEIPNR